MGGRAEKVGGERVASHRASEMRQLSSGPFPHPRSHWGAEKGAEEGGLDLETGWKLKKGAGYRGGGGAERGTEDEKRVGKRGARKGGARGGLERRAKEGGG